MISYDGGETMIAIHTLPKEEQARIFQMAKDSHEPLTAEQAVDAEAEISFSLMYHPTEGTVTYVGWGDSIAEVTGRMTALGFDYGRNSRTPKHGLRRAVYDFCYGYVSGFPVKDIIWYLFTRSLDYRKKPGYLKRWEKKVAQARAV